MNVRFSNIIRSFFFLLLFLPVIAYISTIYFNKSANAYSYIIANVLGFVYIFLIKKRIYFPTFVYFCLIFAIYSTVWPIITGISASRGLAREVLSNPNFAIFFVIIFIYNTSFTDKFIKKTILYLR